MTGPSIPAPLWLGICCDCCSFRNSMIRQVSLEMCTPMLPKCICYCY